MCFLKLQFSCLRTKDERVRDGQTALPKNDTALMDDQNSVLAVLLVFCPNLRQLGFLTLIIYNLIMCKKKGKFSSLEHETRLIIFFLITFLKYTKQMKS